MGAIDDVFASLKSKAVERKRESPSEAAPSTRASGKVGKGNGGGSKKGSGEKVRKDGKRETTPKSHERRGVEAGGKISKGSESRTKSKIKVAKSFDEEMMGRGSSAKGGQRSTQDGYKIYSEEDLKLSSRGGTTKDCPFDCECCY